MASVDSAFAPISAITQVLKLAENQLSGTIPEIWHLPVSLKVRMGESYKKRDHPHTHAHRLPIQPVPVLLLARARC